MLKNKECVSFVDLNSPRSANVCHFYTECLSNQTPSRQHKTAARSKPMLNIKPN